MMLGYTLISGYCDHPLHDGIPSLEFYEQYWKPNVLSHTAAPNVYVVSTEKVPLSGSFNWVNLEYNLGHNAVSSVGKLITTGIAAGSAQLLTGAMIAYQRRQDMIYQEQDCLLFGDCIGQLYREVGDKGGVMGRVNRGGAADSLSANSLLLIKHEFLLDFIKFYLTFARNEKQAGMEPERTMEKIRDMGHLAVMSFGYDRTRVEPFDIRTPCYYQQLKRAELKVLYESRPESFGFTHTNSSGTDGLCGGSGDDNLSQI